MLNQDKKTGITKIKDEKRNLIESSYSIYVHDAVSAKLQIVKYVKEVGILGLKEAKDLVDSIPNTIFINCDYNTADRIAKEMREFGAAVTIKIYC